MKIILYAYLFLLTISIFGHISLMISLKDYVKRHNIKLAKTSIPVKLCSFFHAILLDILLVNVLSFLYMSFTNLETQQAMLQATIDRHQKAYGKGEIENG